FYALLSDNEGDDSLDGALDIGVGRIPCKSLQEANGVVNKIISYDTNPKSLGEWRMRTGFAADDEDNNIHMRQADGIATLTENNHPELNQQKVYFDAYNQESTPGGARYPDARSALVNNIQNGQLVLNYLGHGGPKGWAQERVLQLSDLTNLNNFERLPILVTATCSFTGFDEPNVVSAGELALLNPGGGAIALFSTVRAVYSSQNERITREVFKKIFTRNAGERQTLGDIIQQAQNSNSSDTISSNTRKFMLFGDPSQTIALPQYRVEFTEFNGTDIHEDRIDTLGALSKARVKGHISDYNGVMLEDFNGDVFLTVFDKASTIKTLDNDNKGRFFEFSSRKNTLYKGSASVVDGRFEIEFIIPKDINFEYGKGLLSFYASDNTSRDAGGYYDKIIIGGTSEEGFADNEGPLIQIFFNNRSFVDGGETGKNAIMIVDLEDENGINLSGTSIGHDITAVFDGNQHNPIILNGFYNP
ncbi:MAG: type IX secretion system sortase PorU, partial [Saprospiraceae bacterium]